MLTFHQPQSRPMNHTLRNHQPMYQIKSLRKVNFIISPTPPKIRKIRPGRMYISQLIPITEKERERCVCVEGGWGGGFRDVHMQTHTFLLLFKLSVDQPRQSFIR